MKKGQTERLTEQHILSKGASGIFSEDAKVHDGSEYGKHNDAASAVDELKRTGFKKVEVFKTPITIAQLNTRRKRDGVV